MDVSGAVVRIRKACDRSCLLESKEERKEGRKEGKRDQRARYIVPFARSLVGNKSKITQGMQGIATSQQTHLPPMPSPTRTLPSPNTIYMQTQSPPLKPPETTA